MPPLSWTCVLKTVLKQLATAETSGLSWWGSSDNVLVG